MGRTTGVGNWFSRSRAKAWHTGLPFASRFATVVRLRAERERNGTANIVKNPWVTKKKFLILMNTPLGVMKPHFLVTKEKNVFWHPHTSVNKLDEIGMTFVPLVRAFCRFPRFSATRSACVGAVCPFPSSIGRSR